MKKSFKTFWELGTIRLLVAYEDETGEIFDAKVFHPNGKEGKPTELFRSFTNIDQIWDLLWPKWRVYSPSGRELKLYDPESDFIEVVNPPVLMEREDYDYDYDYHYSDWEILDYEDAAFNSKYSDGW